MANKQILITGVDGNGELTLGPGGHKVHINKNSPDRTVTWRIENFGHNKVRSFKISAKPNQRYPFYNELPTTYEKILQMEVSKDSDIFDWKYDILWMHESGPGKTLDPIIAIRPSNVVDQSQDFIEQISKVALAALSFVAAFFVFKKIRKR